MTEALVHTNDLAVGYNRKRILPPVSFSLQRGEQWALLGPNGSGKTTLLKSVLGLLPVVDGSKQVCDRIAYVAQRSTIDQRLPARVIDIVRGGAERGWSFASWRGKDRSAIERALEETQTGSLVDQQLSELSEGQKQRVLVARALASDPDLLVLDEPTSAMDAVAESTVFELLNALREKRNLGVVVVSHHLPVVVRHATHILAVDKDNPFVFSGTIEEAFENQRLKERYGNLRAWVEK